MDPIFCIQVPDLKAVKLKRTNEEHEKGSWFIPKMREGHHGAAGRSGS